MQFHVSQPILVDGKKAVVTRTGLPCPYGNNSIEYKLEDGSKIKDNPSLASYYAGRTFEPLN